MSTYSFFSFLLFFQTICADWFGRIDQNPVVNIPGFGEIEGETMEVENSRRKVKRVNAYIGVPYAVPPLGDLRFRRSSILQSLSDININDVYMANDTRVCPQASSSPLRAPFETEDCLVLNIYTPSYISKRRYHDGVPVVLYVHGGSSTSNAGINFNGGNFVGLADESVIFITMNYRLGPLGFMASKGIINESLQDSNGSISDNGGAHGLGDIQIALEWIQSNIAAFEGNPKEVTLMGTSVGALLSSIFIAKNDILPEGLFKKLILHSGAPYRGLTAYGAEFGMGLYEELFNGVGLPSPNNLEALRQIPSDLFILQAYGGIDRPLRLNYLPSVDDYYGPVTSSQNDILESITSPDDVYPDEILNIFLSLDSFAGSTGNSGPATFDAFNDYLLGFNIDQDTVTYILTVLYPESQYTTPEERFYALNADVCFVCPAFDTLELLSPYVPQYAVNIAGPTEYDPNLIHFEDTKFLFNDENIGPIDVDFNENYNENLINFFVDFIYGKNVQSNRMKNWHRVKLENYDENRQVLEFGPQINNKKTDVNYVNNYFDSFRNGACHFWDQIAQIPNGVLLRQLLCFG